MMNSFHGTSAQWYRIKQRMGLNYYNPINMQHHRSLYLLICGLFAKTDLALPDKLEVVPSSIVDAEVVFSPLDRSISAVYVTQGAVDNYNRGQMAGMIGHELGHVLQHTNALTSPQDAEYSADAISAKITSYDDIISALKYFLPQDRQKETQQHLNYHYAQALPQNTQSSRTTLANVGNDVAKLMTGQSNNLVGDLANLVPNNVPSNKNVHPMDMKRIHRLEALRDN